MLLEDVDRIEVISGPGATLWGANAVNGVISITTKSATATSGLFIEGGGGTEIQRLHELRYGVSPTPAVSVRFYGKYTRRDGVLRADGRDAANDWQIGQGGVRLDWAASSADQITLQGDSYQNRVSSDCAECTDCRRHQCRRPLVALDLEERRLQAAGLFRPHPSDTCRVPTTTCSIPTTPTFSIDGCRPANGTISCGVRAFVRSRMTSGLARLRWCPAGRRKQTYSGFVQDGIALVANRLNLTLGAKIQDDDYAGVGLQPSARLAWTSRETQTLWTAVSRAVRTPSRLDRDLIMPPVSEGGPDFTSEQLLSYEAGFRANPRPRLSLSIASYYNDYDNIRSIEPARPPAPSSSRLRQRPAGGVLWSGTDRRLSGTRRGGVCAAATRRLRVHIRPRPGSADRSFGQAETATSNRRVDDALDARSVPTSGGRSERPLRQPHHQSARAGARIRRAGSARGVACNGRT